jgi:glycosyltransferase involved in cell wall biosynthesis
MRVFMLGWEFPPFITGGLGTACHGLTKAMDARGLEIIFVMPGATDPSASSHVDLLSPESIDTPGPGAASPPVIELDENFDPIVPVPPSVAGEVHAAGLPAPTSNQGFSAGVEFVHVPVQMSHPYDPDAVDVPIGEIGIAPIAGAAKDVARTTASPAGSADVMTPPPLPNPSHTMPPPTAEPPAPQKTTDYGGDIMTDVRRFAAFAVQAATTRDFDVIHAHDWMTYPAGLAVARRTGKPLVVHVHSTEFDRSGEQVNQRVYDIERRGMHGAIRVITVSRLTRNIVIRRYGVNPDKVTVVYNGVAIDPIATGVRPIGRREKIVLYFGRITRQKGPEYFIRAAARVLQVEPNVRFIVAGSGDLYRRCIELAAELGIGQHFLFTGFLRGADIDKIFAMADLFVMPSVSEPFGIAPLEAMGHDVPVLISKSSGASEVISHALKVDFWDTEAMADKIVAVLRHPPLGQTLRRHGVIDIRRLTWGDAGARCEKVYDEVVQAMGSIV